jgi:hypothetical protein
MVYAGEPLTTICWVQPKLIAEDRLAAWSGYKRVRHAGYLGPREDKAPRDEIARAFRVLIDRTANQPPLPAVFPDQLAPTVRINSASERIMESMRWKLSGQLDRGVVANVARPLAVGRCRPLTPRAMYSSMSADTARNDR